MAKSCLKITFLAAILCCFAILCASCSGGTDGGTDGEHTHTFGEWTVVTEAKCNAEGSLKHVCTVCGEEEITAIASRGHRYVGNSDEIIFRGECTVCNEKVEKPDDLNYALTENGTEYVVTGVKIGIDFSEGIIPSKVNGKNVTGIGASAFKGCVGLTAITIPESVTSIGDGAFWNCGGLTEIVIPDGVKSIGGGAFEYCVGLKSVSIGNGITGIGFAAFYGCGGLTSITLPYVGATKDATENVNFGYIFGASTYSDNNKYIPNSLKTVIITGGTSLGSSAFRGCSGLSRVTIGNGVTSIGGYAFSGCSGLTRVTIGNGVTNIGASAFFGCSALTSITIPTGVTGIDDGAFFGTGMWNNAGDNSVVYADKWAVGYKGDKANLTSVILRSDTVGICSDGFADCRGLTGITVPSRVTRIGNGAFSDCSGLTSIEIPGGVTSIGTSAFSRSGLKSVTIGNGVTGIGDGAFEGCSGLTRVTIGNGVTGIGDYTFKGCFGLTSITYEGSKAKWKAIPKGYDWNNNTENYTVTCTDGTLTKAES